MGVVSILVMRPWAFIQSFVPNSGEDACNLALIGKVVSETIFEKDGRMDGLTPSRWLYYKLTTHVYEPNGSAELKIA